MLHKILSKSSLIFVLAFSCSVYSAPPQDSLNNYVLETVKWMTTNVSNRGYDLHSQYTEDLRYGDNCCIKATNGGKTMCVAAVTETIVRAIDLYTKKTNDQSPINSLPISQFTGSKRLNIKPHLFQFEEVSSRGPGDAFERFGIGEKRDFEKLSPGDFLAFSRRNGSGHSVVFLGYLTKTNELLESYSDSVVGFRYMSAQGKGRPDGGIGYRNAYFASHPECTRYDSSGYQTDCGIFRKSYINAGRIYSPDRWKTNESIAILKEKFRQNLISNTPGITKDAAEIALDYLLDKDVPETFSWKEGNAP